MIRPMNALAVAACCVVALAVGSAMAIRSTQPARPDPVETVASRPEAPRAAIPFVVDQAPRSVTPDGPWGAQRRREVEAMRDDFLRAPDLAAYFEQGLRNPQAGGLFYARHAFRHCTVLRSSSPPDRRGESPLDRARARCGDLGDAVSRERLESTMQTAAARLDPVLSVTAELDTRARGSGIGNGEVSDALEKAIALGDPYLVRNLFFRGISRVDRFDGQPISAEQRGDLMMASRIALCDVGLDCAQEARVLLTCNRNDGCADPLTAMSGDGAMADERRMAIARLAQRMANATMDGTLPQLFR